MSWLQRIVTGFVILLILGALSDDNSAPDQSTAEAAPQHKSGTPRSPSPSASVAKAIAAAIPPVAAAPPATTVRRNSVRARIADAVKHGEYLSGSKGVRVSTTKTTGGYNVTVSHHLMDRLLTSFTRSGAKNDAKAIFQDVFESSDRRRVRSVTVVATGKLMDGLGRESRGAAYTVSLEGSLGRRINWDNASVIDFGRLWNVTVDRIH